ncbi:bifunctional phosphoribosyl-AMP cyclohydrolase/phosphoribosyl-ATP diphosphatase HisIE [Thermosyntropha sp.]|uniref:bifunctional phosphoribosyl-AMP cyclohydrolase/phosphoribosyl-ATP diphosphatase HisIE n=1 Tax=Thermosyntropha sp. TaxID=2740820 RepID=UPI0025F79586|nr:bifunctional phosphoribosyl-AMP cyclohydrolase/phosphoribosyl-ATP diphosphatase HisIE [Thermosyntropha sp.]MBO8158869.1 bifunctional phosphoribosyl-AMP cyclohydrolase/phosphoribosyl-ATP diphosphatase HisIE [Thermosyntropha sp.]
MLENLKFDENGLIPAIVQDYKTGQVLMLAYMNKESLEKTVETKKTWFYSRSRKRLWMKGEESGHIQEVKEMRYDCDADALLVKVEQTGVACHTGHYSCFYRDIEGEEKEEALFDESKIYASGREGPAILYELYEVVKSRKEEMPEGSYTTYLFSKGIDKILKKVGEETAEVIIAAKNSDKGESVYEISDLIYHLMVLMVEKDITLSDIFAELRKRR